jgi:hypothetical protein
MANALYPAFKEALLNKECDLNTDTIVAYLVDLADYTYSSAHAVLTDLPAPARVANVTLGSLTITNGTFDCADATFSSVTGDVSEAVILYDSTSDNLIAYFDTGVTGLPVTPNGGNIALTINASGVFSL